MSKYIDLIPNKRKEIFKMFIRFSKERNEYNNIKNNINQIIENCYLSNNFNSIFLPLIFFKNNQKEAKQDFQNLVIKYLTNKTRKQFFDEFLIENNLKEKYFNNIFKHHFTFPNIKDTDVLNYKHIVNIDNLFSSSFSWSSAEEGYNYWYNINTSFICYLDEKLFKLITI